MRLTMLYRGPLSSCNYDCYYCPFAKQKDTPQQLKEDQFALTRFVEWIENHTDHLLSVFFTPWGEALTRRWYWDAIQRLTSLPHVEKVAIQTNLSANLDWIKNSVKSKVGVWATYHPSQTTLERFVEQVARLEDWGVSFSVGVVGVKEDFEAIIRLKSSLPASVYLWVNAFKRKGTEYYSEEDRVFLTNIDPNFPMNNQYHPSLGKACWTGEKVVSVDGQGNVTRCHFVKESIGNLYADSLDSILKPRDCPNQSCGCHIGYVHLQELKLYPLYGPGLLERVPVNVVNLS